LRTVLLPEPEGPSSATNSPRLMLNDTSRTASTSPPPSWKLLARFFTSMRGNASTAGSVTDAPSSGSAWERRAGFVDESRSHDLADCEWLDACHLAEPDFGTTFETHCIEPPVVVRNLLDDRYLGNVGILGRGTDIGLYDVIDFLGLMRSDPLARAPER